MDDGKKRACTTCARLKMKCRYPYGEEACSRCLRMKLGCSAPVSTPRRPRGKSTRVAQLEQKIDGLVSMLSARPPAFPSPESPFTPATANTEQGQTPPLAGTAVDGLLELIPGFRLTVAQASHYLDVYRSHYMVNFPFVIIETTNALALYTHSPCLFWAVMCAVAPETERLSDEITAWFRKDLAERIIAKQERSIELLQAILVYLEWCVFQFFIGNDGGIFLHLAHTIVDEMRLDKSVDSAWLPASSLLSAAWASMRKDVPAWPKNPHTPADRRAFLGFFHICSLVQSFFRRGPHLKWGEYVSECCDYLASVNQHEYDPYIVGVIKFQLVSEQAARDFAEHPSGGPVMDMALLSAQREMEKILETMPTAVRSNELFLLHYHALVLRLYDPLLTTPGLNRAAAVSLCRMFPAANNFFNTHAALSSSQLAARPFTQSALLAFYIVSVSNLVLYEAPGWDSGIARQHVDFAHHTARLADQFDAVDEFARANRRKRHMKGCSSLYREYGHKFRWMNQWYLGRIADTPPEEAVDPEIQWDNKFWEDLMFFQPIYPISDV